MAIELPELLLADAQAWENWLEAHHQSSRGVWLVLHKKGGTVTELTYAQALDVALCFGWIDGQIRRRDDESYSQRWTPRGPKSSWSLANTENIARLEGEGRLRPAGRAVVTAAQQDGRWEMAYARARDAELPEDLLKAIAANPEAQRMLDVLSATNRFALYFRLSQLKTEAARERKIRGFVEMLARHEAPYPQRARPPV
ncbi:YdeI/OmpD-associated family protein [Psychromicrobium xiongbiense]|uniref:YdeI/OmpD-associated family protein n=1 Tax=Psychromicrobium xiongbiense TaxID=3051184 RepID=UPI0025562F21|nr:YdeI/OmpD-associated family protein [Psychromicrobium sp. YIM S02556]